MTTLPKVTLRDDVQVPALGLGTWTMGEKGRRAEKEIAALRVGLDLGLTLIDTAEMYGDGGAEKLVAKALGGSRDQAFLVSKVYPHNAGRKSAIEACERSLKRLNTDRLDLYLLHWRGSVPLSETVEAFERLREAGKILRWGVSNFDGKDLQQLQKLAGAMHCATNQVLYHLGERGVEWALVPWMRAQGMPLMAYSPLGQGALLSNHKLAALAARRGVSPAQLALAWLLRRPDTIVIVQSSDPAHMQANHAAIDIELDDALLSAIDAAFPPPTGPTPLAML
jgi:diketogulonate reductase-like aldo/keto reductase